MKIRHFLVTTSISIITILVAISIPPGFTQTIKRDYEASTPLPQTKQLTIRQPLKELPSDRLFAKCPANSQLTEFAESNNFLVMVCREGGDRGLTKHWLQKSKKTGKQTQLKAQDRPNSQPSTWKSGDYEASINSDGAKPNLVNAYLESYNTKTKQGRSEALIYHYAKSYDLGVKPKP
jgi:hypothetical protein